MIGTRLSHYKVTAHLGTGGMGEVYRAHDERLGRDVAIKVLRRDLLADDAARARLRREARSLSRLNHPNICTVFDFDSDGDRTFMIVELLDGETLAQRVSHGPLPADEIRRIGLEIAGALEAAHEQGVVHRDLKPGNVIVTKRGVTKVLDFGLARLTREPTPTVTTQSAMTGEHSAGTLPYMAPEQVRGEAIDGRSDIYGLGATLYELATGRRPFAESQPLALAAAILYQTPEPPRSLGSKIDPTLEGVILRCLEKDPARRFQTAAEVQDALTGGSPPVASPGRRRIVISKRATFVALLVALTALAYVFQPGSCDEDRRSTAHMRRAKGLAVLPLANLSGDASEEYFADGMTEELITTLGQISALRVTSRGSVMKYKNSAESPRDIAHALGVDLLIEGALMKSGSEVRVSAKIVDAANDVVLWSGSFDRAITEVFALQSDVANAVVEAVKVGASPDERSRLRRTRLADPAAHEAYLRGRELEEQYTKETLLKAITSYEKSAMLQPDFAPAYAGIASCYLQLSTVYLEPGEAMPRAESASLKALAIDSTSAGALASLAYVRGFYRFEWEAAESDLRRAIRFNPSQGYAHNTLGYLLAVLGRFAESRGEFQIARSLDPLSQVYAAYSIMPLYEGRDYDEAIRESTRILSADPDAGFVRMIRAQAYAMKGDYQSAIGDLRTTLSAEVVPSVLAVLYYVQMKAGAEAAAESSYAELKRIENSGYVHPYTQATICVARGDHNAAFGWLERAAESRTEELVWLRDDPFMDPLRGDPRFRALVRRVRLEN